MRLINTRTFRLQEFFDSSRPKYAIISHTWGTEEISLQEWMEWEDGDSAKRAQIEAKRGFAKIQSACQIALILGHNYIWVDTSCIDKKSSAELSEAINSMFSWYQSSEICFAYLEDFAAGAPANHMSRCRWFTRGWTLQELLAPHDVLFFDATWESFGSKTTLYRYIRDITGVDTDILREPRKINAASAAKKMSWASSRQTTRPEDLAYCLLGLFHINMPLLYGEGNDAFRRLQEEIIKVSTDQSLFAWDWPSTVPASYRGGNYSATIMAPSPSAFRNCHDVLKGSRHMQGNSFHKEFAMTNLGLNIALPLLAGEHDACYGALNCTYERLIDFLICIPLSTSDSKRTFYRDHSRDILVIPRDYPLESPTSISLPRYSESPEYVNFGLSSGYFEALASGFSRQLAGFRRPKKGDVSFLIFPSKETLETWEIKTSWGPSNKASETWEISLCYGYNQASQRVYVERQDIPRDIWANSITLRDRKSDSRRVFVILWASELAWGHVCSEDYDGELEDDVEDSVLKRAVNNAPSTGQTTATHGEVRLEVGFSYSMRNNLGGRWVSVFLGRCSETVGNRGVA